MRRQVLIGAFVWSFTATLAQAATFALLGDLPGGPVFSRALAISADGATVVGDSRVEYNDNRHAFRWTAASGMTDLGLLPNPFPFGGSSYAYAVSGNGSVVLGVSVGFPVGGAYRWTAPAGMVPLAADQGSARPTGISSDGSVIVGSDSANGIAFRWTQSGGFENLGDLPGGRAVSAALGVSADGSVIVGTSEVTDDFKSQAFRWTAADGMVSLGSLPGGGLNSRANAASADGAVIVGMGTTLDGFGSPEAFRWTASDGMVGLGDLDGGNFDSEALGVSADGSVVVGIGSTFNGPGGNSTSEAFVWTPGGGMQRLLDVLLAQGATGLDGWLLLDATGISADGTAVVGMAQYTDGTRQAYVAHLSAVPAPATAGLIAPALGLLMPWARRRARPGEKIASRLD